MADGPYWIESNAPGRVAILPRPRGGDWLGDEARAWAGAGIDVVVSLLTEEEAEHFKLADESTACRDHGIEFLSFPVVDRGVPASRIAAADLVTQLADSVRAGKRVGFHCRQGIGRSAVLAAAVLVALGVGPESALARIAAARGLPVPETPEQRQWVTDFARLAVKAAR
jgi:protein-tyrosine phosphatase